MTGFRLRIRLRDEPETTISAAIHDWGSEGGDAEAIARLEERLSVALATPVAAPVSTRKQTWLLGLSVAAAAAALALSLAAYTQSHDAPHTASWRELQAAGDASANGASYFGTGPRDLANAGLASSVPMTAMTAMHAFPH